MISTVASATTALIDYMGNKIGKNGPTSLAKTIAFLRMIISKKFIQQIN
jgi:hypothetical protein